MDNIKTFLFAGSDTTSLALTWTLLLLAKHPATQARLRIELLGIRPPLHNDEDSTQMLWKSINEMTFLDNVCREALRVMPPVHSALRIATKDDFIPVSAPFMGADGEMHDVVRICAGTLVHLPFEGMNLDRFVWGPDAWQFKLGAFVPNV